MTTPQNAQEMREQEQASHLHRNPHGHITIHNSSLPASANEDGCRPVRHRGDVPPLHPVHQRVAAGIAVPAGADRVQVAAPPAHACADAARGAGHRQPRRRERVRRDVRGGVRGRQQEHHQLLHLQGHAHGPPSAVRDEPPVLHLTLQLRYHQRSVGRRLLPSLARKGEAGPGRESDDHAPPPIRQMDQEMRPRENVRADFQREPGHHAPEAAGDRGLADR